MSGRASRPSAASASSLKWSCQRSIPSETRSRPSIRSCRPTRDWSTDGLERVTHLSLRSNRLTTLPDAIGEMRQLMHLDLRENQLTSLPEGLRQLQSLEKLDVRWNGLTEIRWLDELRERGCIVYT